MSSSSTSTSIPPSYRSPLEEDPRYVSAQSLIKEGSYDEALEFLEEVLAISSTKYEVQ